MKLRLSAALAIALLAIGAQAAPHPKPDRVKVLITWADNRRGHVPVKGADFGGEDVAEYDNYRIVALPEAAAAQLEAKVAARGLHAQRRDDFDDINLPGGHIDARRGLDPLLPADQLVSGYPTGGLYVVQLIGPSTPSWFEGLARQGAKVVVAVPQNAYLVIANTQQSSAIEKLAYVQFVSPLHPALKATVDASADRDVLVEIPDEGGDAVLARVRTLDAKASVYGTVAGRRFVQAHVRAADVGQLLREPLVIGLTDLPRLHISDERQVMSTTTNIATVNSQDRPTNPTTYQSWLASACPMCASLPSNFRVGIADTGLDSGPGTSVPHHPDLPASRMEYGADFTNSTLADDVGHGTAVAGIIAGNNATGARDFDAAGYSAFFMGTGIAPSAHIFSTRGFGASGAAGSTAQQWVNDAAAHGVTIQNHSNNDCHTNTEGLYTAASVLDDGFVRDTNGTAAGGAPITLTVSSGNRDNHPFAPTIVCNRIFSGPPATAKNVISVGGLENFRDSSDEQLACRGTAGGGFRNMMSYGKHGTLVPNVSPDGFVRQWSTYIKPDLVAPASLITSARSTAANPAYCEVDVHQQPVNQQYIEESGTSFAAPVAAGAAIFASRIYSEVVSPGNPNPALASPSLLKAMLIGSAVSIEGGLDNANNGAVIGPRPNDVQGFGRVSIVDMIDANPKSYVNQTYRFTTSGGNAFHALYYHRNMSAPARAVLTWTDAPGTADANGSAQSNPPLVNDLDLYVNKPFVRPLHQPCSDIYYGNNVNTGDSGVSITCMSGVSGVGQDYRNTAELVPIPAGTYGLLDVSVSPKQIQQAADPNISGPNQDFSLYIYNASQRGDINRDGKPDIIWRRTGIDAPPLYWTQRDGSASAQTDFLVHASWNIEAVGDFDLNGSDDLVYRDTATGHLAIGQLSGTSYVGLTELPAMPDLNWYVGGAGDMNFDGYLDLIVRNQVTGQNRIWYMNGMRVDTVVDLPTVNDPNYHIEGVADFDNDGVPDVLWHNYSTGNVVIWRMIRDSTVAGGTTVATGITVTAVDHNTWHIGAVGDYNNDSMNDVVWRNATNGQIVIWWGAGNDSFPTSLTMPGVADQTWQIAGPR